MGRCCARRRVAAPGPCTASRWTPGRTSISIPRACARRCAACPIARCRCPRAGSMPRPAHGPQWRPARARAAASTPGAGAARAHRADAGPPCRERSDPRDPLPYRALPRHLVGANGRRPERVGTPSPRSPAVVIGDLAGFVEPFGESSRPWLQLVESIERRGLLGTRGPGRLAAGPRGSGIPGRRGWQRRNRAGAAWFGPTAATLPPDASAAAPLPEALRKAGRWSRTTPPLQRVDAALDAFLHADGRLLLAAMAAYPQLHWGLTRALDLRLVPEFQRSGQGAAAVGSGPAALVPRAGACGRVAAAPCPMSVRRFCASVSQSVMTGC